MDNLDPSSRTWPITPAPGPAEPPPTPGQQRFGRRRLTRWAAGVGLAALLVGGGIAALTSATASASPGTGTAGATSAQLLSSSQIDSAVQAAEPGLSQAMTSPATLRSCLARAGTQRAAGHLAAARQIRRACLGGLRLRLRGEHGTVTFSTKNGPVTIAWERGQVVTAPNGGTTFSVKAKDGTVWTWTLTSKTRIRQGGKLVTSANLTQDAQVFVFGRVPGGIDTAAVVLIAK